MSDNPYDFDGADDDLLEEVAATAGNHHLSVRGHNLDGAVCKKCLRVHDLSNIPKEIREPLVGLMSTMDDRALDELLARYSGEELSYTDSDFISMFRKHTNYMNVSGSEGPLYQAVMDTLDELTDGKSSKTWHKYEFLRQLVGAKNTLNIMNNLLEDAVSGKYEKIQDDAEFQRCIHLVRFYCDFTIEKIASIYSDYADACEALGEEPLTDEQVSNLEPSEFTGPMKLTMQNIMKHGR